MTRNILFHDIKTPELRTHVVHQGVKSTFAKGVIYRYAGMVPLLEVSGDHYEMGLQYGVLLRSEILEALQSFEKISRWQAETAGVPHPALFEQFVAQGKRLARHLPERFIAELQGVSEGSGVPLDLVTTIALIYDISESKACTGLLMKDENGAIIHGRNNDSGDTGGEELGKLTVVVRHHADGYNTVTHMDYPLFMGVETGYNDKGLTFSEETLAIRQPNPDGFSLIYLVRMALEECSDLTQLAPLLNRHQTVGAYGCVWGSQHQGDGLVTELTPSGWATIEMKGTLLWNYNRFYTPELARQQQPAVSLGSSNRDREAISATFPQKSAYTLRDAVDFLRLQKGPDGTDYARTGTRWPVCNWSGQQMMVFDPQGDGFYLAWGVHYAARQDVYHIYEDFSRPPELFMPAIPLDPIVEEVARVENRLVSRKEKLAAFVALAQAYPQDAYANFVVAHESFRQSRWDLFADHAEKAYMLEPTVVDHQLYAGLAAYQREDMDKAVALLKGIDVRHLHPWQKLYRLVALKKADPKKAAQYERAIQAILDEHDAHAYFEKDILPLLDALDARGVKRGGKD